MERHSLEGTWFLRWLRIFLLIVDRRPSLWICETLYLVWTAYISAEDLRKLILIITSIYVFLAIISNLMYRSLVSTVSEIPVQKALMHFLLVLLVASLASCFLGWILSPVVFDYSKLSQDEAKLQSLDLILASIFLIIIVFKQTVELIFVIFNTRRLSVILLAPTVFLIMIIGILFFIALNYFYYNIN